MRQRSGTGGGARGGLVGVAREAWPRGANEARGRGRNPHLSPRPVLPDRSVEYRGSARLVFCSVGSNDRRQSGHRTHGSIHPQYGTVLHWLSLSRTRYDLISNYRKHVILRIVISQRQYRFE
ncbi:unnamed protein product [Nezara viridula]|uniref:Uncharacterized protein n=1 Tax=Nezara viridula TaxID=85310 RepID=A0A9P0MQ09_NEZVI|nr:unnamed protein product [Nezara viridula]